MEVVIKGEVKSMGKRIYDNYDGWLVFMGKGGISVGGWGGHGHGKFFISSLDSCGRRGGRENREQRGN